MTAALDRLAELEAERQRTTDLGGHTLWRPAGWDAAVRNALPALLAVAQAADLYRAYTGEHYWRCEYRTAEKGWKKGDPPVIECVCGLDALNDALAALEAGSA